MPTKQRRQIRKGSHGGMQLVLTEDVPYLGKQGELVEVRGGYGRNYLLPNGLATVPTEHNLRLLERYKERVQQARSPDRGPSRFCGAASASHRQHRVERQRGRSPLRLGRRPEISKALKAMNLNVEPEMVRLEGPIKECALFAVKIHLGYDIESEVKVLVVRQQEKQ